MDMLNTKQSRKPNKDPKKQPKEKYKEPLERSKTTFPHKTIPNHTLLAYAIKNFMISPKIIKLDQRTMLANY